MKSCYCGQCGDCMITRGARTFQEAVRDKIDREICAMSEKEQEWGQTSCPNCHLHVEEETRKLQERLDKLAKAQFHFMYLAEKYEVREDGIYLRSYNVRVATFHENTRQAREDFDKVLRRPE